MEGTSVIITELELHTACLFCDILFVKRAAKSLHDLLGSSSGGIDAMGFISLSTAEKSVWALLRFILVISEKYDYLLVIYVYGMFFRCYIFFSVL